MIFWIRLACFRGGISAMRAQFRLSDLTPAELNVKAVHRDVDTIVIAAHGQSPDYACPQCGTASRGVHGPPGLVC